MNGLGTRLAMPHQECPPSGSPDEDSFDQSPPLLPPPHLGIKQSGEKLDDIVLPPWAKGDAHEFIRIHREVRDW